MLSYGNPGAGFAITAGNGNQIKGNFIGTNALGDQRLGNNYGVSLPNRQRLWGDEAGAGTWFPATAACLISLEDAAVSEFLFRL